MIAGIFAVFALLLKWPIVTFPCVWFSHFESFFVLGLEK